MFHSTRILLGGAILAAQLVVAAAAATAGTKDGIVKVPSAYSMGETVARLKQDIADKGIMVFEEIDQAKLAAEAGTTVRPSILLVFGNPALGTSFLASNPTAGLDWPVRLLVIEDADGKVWAVYTDFSWIARRHKIKDRKQAFATAADVIGSITASVRPR